jgi:hypothetical protein
MPTPQEIEAFKLAFRAKADEKFWGPRWEKAKGFFEKQTSLTPIVQALDKLKTTTNSKNLKAVHTAISGLSKGKASRYEAALNLLKENLKTIMVEEESVGEIRLGKLDDGTLVIRGSNGEEIASGVDPTKLEYVKNVLTGLTTAGVNIDGLDKLIKTIVKDPKMGADSGQLAGTIWEQAIAHLKDTVLDGIDTDLDGMKTSGLLPDTAQLKGVEFTGSDFHKGGKQVLILRFEDENGKEKKVVYKPSSLMVDSLLYGNDGVGAKLGDISTYNIVPITTDDDPPKDEGYGYMEFIDTGDGATSPEDVAGIFVSVAGNMAMSYYVGLDDVHQENILILTSGVQIIDMEATTGVFSSAEATATTGGFYDQLWNKALWEGVRPELEKLIVKKQLTELPDELTVANAMVKRFNDVIKNMSKSGNKTDLKKLQTELAKQTTRTVPIATNAFQKDLIPKAKAYASLDLWTTMLDDDLLGDGVLLNEAKGQTTTPPSTIKNLLYTKGVYNALRRGDVPYYTRDLGSDKVKDELGEEIDVPGYKKVGLPIDQAMEARRTADPAEALKIFKAQALKQLHDILENLKVQLAVAKIT